jgi:hypothetical protein
MEAVGEEPKKQIQMKLIQGAGSLRVLAILLLQSKADDGFGETGTENIQKA